MIKQKRNNIHKNTYRGFYASNEEGDVTLLKRRIIATVLIVLVAGFATFSAFVWTKKTKADTNFDPFYSLETSSPKVRIFQPLEQSIDNPSDFTANGQSSPGATVTLKVDGVSVGTTTANNKGVWSKNVSGIEVGEHQLTASETISGPLALVTSESFSPGFGLLDLQTNSITSSYNTGISTLFFTSFGENSGNDTVTAPDVATPQGSRYAYAVRRRSVLVIDTVTQKPLKNIALSQRFITDGVDNGQVIKKVIADEAHQRLYLMFTNDSATQILAIDTSTNTLVSGSDFNPTITAGVTDALLVGNELYVAKKGAQNIQRIDLDSNTVNDIATTFVYDAMVLSADSQKIYFSGQTEGVGNGISEYIIADGTFEDNTVDLGGSITADFLFTQSSGQKLYVLSDTSSDVRVIDTATHAIIATIDLGAVPKASLNRARAVFNTDQSRLFVPLQDSKVAIVDTGNDQKVASVNVPASNYQNLYNIMFYNNKLYLTYARLFDGGDILNLSQIFQSIGMVSGDVSGDVIPQTLTSIGSTTLWASLPIPITPQTYTGQTNFSVGKPITITSPTKNETLDSSTPTISGKGPRNKTIQLVVNTNTPIDVTVDNDGNWQKQISLPKNKSSTINAVYQNKRTQLVIPTHTFLGANIAKSELAIIDGASALQQQGINLGDTSLQNIKLNNGSAINPNGQRYYVINSDATSLATTLTGALSNGTSAASLGQEAGLALVNAEVGNIGVYSAQTRQQVANVSLPAGMVPLGMAVSPNGKRGIVTAIDLPAEMALLNSSVPLTTETPGPISLFEVNLENNTIVGDKIQYKLNLAGFTDNADPQVALQTYLSMASTAYVISRPGNFSPDSSKFYTTAAVPGKMSVITVGSHQVSTLSLPSQLDMAVLLSSQLNKANGILYVTYLNIVPPLNGTDPPQFVPGIALINTANNQLVGQSAIPNIPLFNFAVSPSGSKVYFITANISDFIAALASTGTNSSGLLADTLPQFSIGVYDLGVGSYNEYPISSTDIPIALALSPDGSRVFVPTLLGNVVHVFDTATNQVDPANAPIILPGVSLMLSSGDYAGEAILGAYTDSATYYVPPDAPAATSCCTVINNQGTNTVQFRYLPSAQQAAILPQSITVPQQTVKTLQQTVEKTIEKQKAQAVKSTQRTWLVYIFYTILMLVLGAIGVTVWRTDMVLGSTVANDLFS